MTTDEEPLLVVRRVSLDDPRTRVLVDAVQQEYVTRYGSPDETPLAAAQFQAPTGVFLLGELDGAPVVCGGLRRQDPRTAEIKRLFVVPDVRRRGLARTMLQRLERAALDAGYSRVVLETGDRQPEALDLYLGSGYTPVSPYGHYRHHPHAHSLGKVVGDRVDRSAEDAG